jgi:hypothetical protein
MAAWAGVFGLVFEANKGELLFVAKKFVTCATFHALSLFLCCFLGFRLIKKSFFMN